MNGWRAQFATMAIVVAWWAAGCSSNGNGLHDASGSGGTAGDGGSSRDASEGTGGVLAAGGSAGRSGDGGSTGGGGAASLGPNCAGLPDTCGPLGNESCCTCLNVPGGTFYRGYDGSSPYAKTDYPATISPFALDKYEVTVGRYRGFVEANLGTKSHPPAEGAGAHPLIPGSGWNSIWNSELPMQNMNPRCVAGTWSDAAGPNENLPMNCVPWYEAFAFCIWDGGRLPTEAEWNYAAAGGSEQRKYPWGAAEPDPTRAVFNCLADAGQDCALTAILPVGSKPDGNGKYGHADLAGSVWEWVFDVSGAYPVPCNDCTVVSSDQMPILVIRGGSYGSSSLRIAASRSDGYAMRQTTDLGFRCARASPGIGAS